MSPTASSAAPRLRAPAVAGTFYPADASALAAVVDAYLDEAEPQTAPAPKAIIAPHAGYIYSGPVAATAYRHLRSVADRVTRVVLLGPAHRVAVRCMAVPTVDGFTTPLGVVPIDRAARDEALTVPGVTADDRPHAPEHSLEVHLPFLQRVLGPDWQVLPVVVGNATPEQVGALLDRVWGGDETLIVVSTDLSHYHEYDVARARDEATAAAIARGDLRPIGPYDACGFHPVGGLLSVAGRRHLAITLLDLRNSGDTAGPRDRVVGYGAFSVAQTT